LLGGGGGGGGQFHLQGGGGQFHLQGGGGQFFLQLDALVGLVEAEATAEDAEAAGTAFAAAPRFGAITVTCELVARFKSTEPDKTRSATEEPFSSSLTREFGAIIARLLSAKKMVAAELEVAISSPATNGKDHKAVTGTALPSNVSGPELVILPTGSAALRAKGAMTISRHKYLMYLMAISL
jgi:hypothetical protein